MKAVEAGTISNLCSKRLQECFGKSEDSPTSLALWFFIPAASGLSSILKSLASLAVGLLLLLQLSFFLSISHAVPVVLWKLSTAEIRVLLFIARRQPSCPLFEVDLYMPAIVIDCPSLNLGFDQQCVKLRNLQYPSLVPTFVSSNAPIVRKH